MGHLISSQRSDLADMSASATGVCTRRIALNGSADKAEEIAAELRALGHSVEKTDLDIA